ncbi:MAG TPA: UDP-N-acetylglucosamine 2-epimerase (non-hydrolyzing) [Allosphingosinicella sp.]|nr:UDP-N-acetylglucosamine 2-epimerase (non-hydrolyzing) [Allosphingosinicella sp.]
MAVFGTRPEAVKLAPVLRTLQDEPDTQIHVCVTGQHRDLTRSTLDFFSLHADFDLEVMTPQQALNPLLARLVERLDPVLVRTMPDRVIVQGDTTTAMAAALAAFHRRIPVAHVEAGLRTYRGAEPYPEEYNRRAIGLIADMHFAPTRGARDNLAAERLNGEVFVTGNSGIDALDLVLRRLAGEPAFAASVEAALPPRIDERREVLVTAHRRESFGAPFQAICAALAELAAREDLQILFPLHPNPGLRMAAEKALGGRPRIRLLPPLDLPCFVRLMERASLILTDSGGVQEEAVALGRPVLVLRDATERPEGVEAGAALRVGTDPARILHAAHGLLDAPPAPATRSQLYGDGHAAERIVAALMGRPVEQFARDWPRIEGLRRIG